MESKGRNIFRRALRTYGKRWASWGKSPTHFLCQAVGGAIVTACGNREGKTTWKPFDVTCEKCIRSKDMKYDPPLCCPGASKEFTNKLASGYYSGDDLRSPELPEESFLSLASGRYATEMRKYYGARQAYRMAMIERYNEMVDTLFEDFGIEDTPNNRIWLAAIYSREIQGDIYKVFLHFKDILPRLKRKRQVAVNNAR